MWKTVRPLVATVYRRIFPPTQKQIFQKIYASNLWRSGESRSGRGSAMDYTHTLRESLPALLAEFNVTSMLDLPCGDFNWMKTVQLPFQDYIGADIVAPLIADVQSRYGDSGHQFQVLDLVKDDLPAADLLLCRDCMMHLSYELIERAVANLLRSDLKYVLLTTYPNGENRNINTGKFFEINLTKQPFHFPAPLREIEDWMPPFPQRRLALWKCEDLRAHFRTNPLNLN